MFTDFSNDHAGGKDRDSFAPQIVGDPQQDADNYSAEDFSWSLVDAPEDSTATIEYRPSDNDIPQYDPGQNNVAEFNPDVAGRYVLELDAPDGTHHQELYMFPEDGGGGGPPRIEIEGEYDSDAEEFVLDANPKLAPNSPMSEGDLFVAWLADTRDALPTEDIQAGEGMDSWVARIPKSALGGESCRVHAAPSDTNTSGYQDTVVLNPDENAVEYPNRPPEWAKNGIMYQIFPRSFMGPPEDGEWPLTNSNAHFAGFESKLDYLEELNVDVIWFCPTVPSESGNWKPQKADSWTGSTGNRFKFVGGGPHGYDALSYYQKAEDLTSEYSFEEYKDAPWPWEDGYDAENNVREDARASAMEEFQSFIEAAHERDIKVCLDFVINHGGRHHPLFQDTIASEGDYTPEGWTYPSIAANNESSKYFDWFTRQDQAIEDDSGTVVDPAPAATGFADLRVMPQWNYSNIALREHILAAAKHWAETGVDAFRCDIAYGVPHGMWKEIREVVRAENSEFMMLDETIPNDPDFGENEFDMHFDTEGFLAGASYGVANGGDPEELFNTVVNRKNEGWPDHDLIINANENHDEFRLYDQAEGGPRGDPAKAQRAIWASGVLLPGIPFIYYGQERLITKYGYERFDYDGSGEDYRTGDGDAGPGNPARAFMNWEENGDTVPQDHLQFYKDVTQFYKDNDIFKPDAKLSGAWAASDDSILAFGRTMETDDGEQNVIVLLHFEPGTAQVDLLPGAETEDWYTGNDIGTDSEGDAVTVEFDTLAVVETDSLFNLGTRIAQLDDATGDDNGPGTYTYPTSVDDGAFDISEVTIHTTADGYQFRMPIEGELQVDENGQITDQHIQVYLRNPNAEDGATDGREGTNITLEDPYQYRLVANGSDGAWVEDHTGEMVAEGSILANPVADEIVVEMPKSALDAGIQSHYVAPLLLGYDGDATGGVIPVESEASETAFGGADNPEMAPRVIDMIVPETASQSDALAYGDQLAVVPYTPLSSDYELAGTVSDPEGDDNGPGNLQYPSTPEDAYYDGAFDLTNVRVLESRSRYRFEYTMRTAVENPWGLENGFSQQFAQIYIHDPDAGDDVPATTQSREGVNVELEEPYHYRIAVHGQGLAQVEDAESGSISTDVNVAVSGDTILFDVPKDAIGGNITNKKLAALMVPFDGFGPGSVRAGVAESPGNHTIGTSGEPTETAPRVMDMVPPNGTSQTEALAYSGSSIAQIPLAEFSTTYISSEGVKTIEDPEGDDNGPGTYTYPTADAIPEGCYDVSKVDIEGTTTSWDVTVNINGPVTNPWGGDAGFSVQAIQMYLQDPNAPDDAAESATPREGMISSFQEGYHYRVVVHGESGPKVVEDANGETVAELEGTAASEEESTISFSIPKAPFQTDDIGQMKMAMVMLGTDAFGTGGIRQNFGAEAGQWAFGGANPDALQSAPRVLDLVGPDAVVDQEAALSYGADSPAVIPLYPVSALVSGVPAEGALTAIAAPGPTVFSGMNGQLNGSNSSDPNDQELTFSWEQTGGPDASLSDADTAQPTFTAPEVDEETDIEFTLTITNEDGDTATDTTTATVQPQSANDAPVARVANSDRMVNRGSPVLLDAAPSTDPNGGELTFSWEQTGGEPSVELTGADTSAAGFTAPEPDEEVELEFTVTVGDSQGKSDTATVTITVPGAGGGEGSSDTGSGFGPGFGVVSGALGTAGGAAYAAKRLLGTDDPAQPEDVDVDDVEEPADD
jgi:carbohydrate-binding DOMON domain-containing protein/glycosidase